MLEKCCICPRECNVNRIAGEVGYCNCDDKLKVALVSTHMYEEPCISGEKGSGTIFFSNCNLKCEYCQNYEISQKGKGKEITVERLAEIFIEQQERNVNNINLVTPTMYVEQIINAIKIARTNGLTIPILYNSNGYEKVDTLKKLEGVIDVYLPDFKYYYDNVAIKYSKAPNYFEIASNAIKEMYRQVGPPQFDDNGIITRGLIVRHLILPNHMYNTKNVLKWIKNNLGSEAYVSIMTQYFPTYNSSKYKELNRKITNKEYKEIQKYMETIEIQNGYIQHLEHNEQQYVPIFDYTNV